MVLKNTHIKFIISLQDGLFYVFADDCDKEFTTDAIHSRLSSLRSFMHLKMNKM